MSTILNTIFQESETTPFNNTNHEINIQNEIDTIRRNIQEQGLSTELEFEFWKSLKNKAGWLLATVMKARDIFNRNKQAGYRDQSTVLTEDRNKNNTTIQPIEPPKNLNKKLNEVSVIQEIFTEAENEFGNDYDVKEYSVDEKGMKGGHRSNQRKSNEAKHQKGNRRRGMDQKGEKGDARRPYQR